MTRQTYTHLSAPDSFAARHIATSANDQAQMLAALGYPSRQAMMDALVPTSIRRHDALSLGEFSTPLPEHLALKKLKQLALQNRVLKSFIGQGYYNTLTPAVIMRNVLENPAWYTAYTPYQPEISQGRLEALLNFQQLVMDMTGMDIANASMLDEATAAAEAMTMAFRNSRSKSSVFLVADDVFPQTLNVLQTRAIPLSISIKVFAAQTMPSDDAFGVLLQYPGVHGAIRDYSALCAAQHEKGAIITAASDLLALTLLKPPGEWGADIVVGNSQRFGVPLGFGGPHAGFMACRDALKRNLPGRIVGVSKDSQGAPIYRLALQTREQHIRREKATSNICTAQALLAMMASFYATYHGPKGLIHIAQRIGRLTAIFADGLIQLGLRIINNTYFDTVTINVIHAPDIHKAAHKHGINLREIDAHTVGVSFDETSTESDVMLLWSLFANNPTRPNFVELDATADVAIPSTLVRNSPFLTHPVFNTYHSEHAMLRYLRALSDKDLALDRSMIPLGSCTMKLNATSEMLPITWPEFAEIHPFAPESQTQGYRTLITQLEAMLCAATGYAAVSLQPNSGSQGEYAGLLAIQAYHASNGQGQRNICLIPASAHGTNPASAAMVNFKVVVVACDERGNVDLNDLRDKAKAHSEQLSCAMVTYPSTHGVFEEGITTLCDIIHSHGGQVYIDGANMNALVGVAAPGCFGGDVSHLNLHKTFCIPHGGGGPGVGPIAVAAHLAPYLPGHEQSIGAISAAPYGSASILPISWMYIAMMGAQGLKDATESAILAANYIAKKLAPHFPVLYTGHDGLVAHECILDARGLTQSCGITNEDIAKRLMDYGFHAPTMSFPVAGTLMVEPTESEPLAELDRFITAMISIREEIRTIESGQLNPQDNPLKHAPHTAAVLCTPEWNHAYSREQAAFPLATLRRNKYWTPVGRADNVYGDRNLFCACVPISE